MTDQEILNKYGFSNIDVKTIRPILKEVVYYTIQEEIQGYHNYHIGYSTFQSADLVLRHIAESETNYISPNYQLFLIKARSSGIFFARHRMLINKFNSELPQ